MKREDSPQRYPDVKCFIAGDWREGGDREQIAVRDPATGASIGSVASAVRSDLERAVQAGVKGFAQWHETGPQARALILGKAATLLRERVDAIAHLLTWEQGKPLAEAVAEIHDSADVTDWLAEQGRRNFGRVIPPRKSNVMQYTMKLPVGQVAAFTPWNFPVSQVAIKLAAALAAGCSVIVKAPEETPASPAALIQAFLDAGVPDHAINLVYGVPGDISEFLIPHPDIAAVSFTGSTRVGKHLASLAGQHMKRSTMELGGHAPVLIFDDADLALTVQTLATAKFRNAGQVCASPTRFLVQNDTADAFVERFADLAGSIAVGNGLDPQTRMGPLANERRVHALEALVSDALAHGATLRLGGRRLDRPGYFFAPTVLTNVPITARIMNEEPFGPVAIVNRFQTLNDAIAEANRLPYGLASYAFSRSAATIHEVSRRVVAGMTSINHGGLGLPEVPFGGVRDSGYGEEGGPDAIEPYLMSKFVTVAV
ncbi:MULTISPECIES: NAD-dependent succinate-semialdehyde dehydrogenase [Pandoraea]|uniref:NAD-dependent succinate-semialdehyde dehydrogenase n=1 Tax=Pandoraea TaxID=93217 RepID=UPI001F5D50C9|nr:MULTISPECIES: NAD-dependent succinate-semialdehyde dehydrogenase [Pandoraea]MCI3208039.1 NAD-dependent succinate-semialdehyde dehydrogenase [Pandoraea sp. LA3]MDN4586068.1 NAD-dependent succinate-semialdehyde dehydrogenase [Pandoraea capi]